MMWLCASPSERPGIDARLSVSTAAGEIPPLKAAGYFSLRTDFNSDRIFVSPPTNYSIINTPHLLMFPTVCFGGGGGFLALLTRTSAENGGFDRKSPGFWSLIHISSTAFLSVQLL